LLKKCKKLLGPHIVQFDQFKYSSNREFDKSILSTCASDPLSISK